MNLPQDRTAGRLRTATPIPRLHVRIGPITRRPAARLTQIRRASLRGVRTGGRAVIPRCFAPQGCRGASEGLVSGARQAFTLNPGGRRPLSKHHGRICGAPAAFVEELA